MTLAANTILRSAIFQRGKTQTTIAKAAGLSESKLSRIIHGHSEPTIDEKKAIAKALRCQVHDVFPEAVAS